ncbi:4486_t:CDS:2, partial [Racocetra fulgida]
VTKIHSALKFRQSSWIKDYIEENIRKQENKKIRRLASSPLYVGFKAFEGGITA